MPPRSRRITLGVLAGLFFALVLWLANLAVAHWFFADFHSESARRYEILANRFALLALTLLLGFVYALRLLLKNKKSAV